MDSRLTDAELIQLVQEKLPEELSHAEIHQLHARLRDSSELKAVLIGQLHLETYLNTALSEIDVSVEEIIRRAGKMEQTKNPSRWPLWTGLAGVLLLTGIGIFFATRPSPESKKLTGDPAQRKPAVKKAVAGQNTNGTDPKQNPVNVDPLPKNPNPPPAKNTDPPQQPKAIVEAQPVVWGKPTDPWYESLDPQKPPRPLTATAFQMPAFERGEMLQKEEANRWLAAAPGQSFRIDNRESNQDRWVELGGVGKLRTPWAKRPCSGCRCSILDHFRLHFWCGEEGVSLWHYQLRHPHEWAAYKARRKKNQPRPEHLTTLLTTDDGRQSRVRSGVVEFRYQDGSLVMSQGTVRLLTVPLPGPPKEVIFDGKLHAQRIDDVPRRTLAAVREKSPPPRFAIHPPRRSRVDDANPRPRFAHRNTRTRTGAGIERLLGGNSRRGRDLHRQGRQNSPRGRKVRAADPRRARSSNGRGCSEIIFRVEDASPGTGIYFGDDQGRELHRVGFHREKRTGQVVFDISLNQKNQIELDQDPDRLPVPYFTSNHWLRVVWGFGSFKIWTSGDGIHWGTADAPARNLPGPCSSLGLMIQKTEEPRQITLSHLEIRELSAITTLASETSREKAPSFGDLTNMDFGTWNEKVLSSWPLDDQSNPLIDMADWRRACAIRSLAESPWTPLSATLLRGLIEDGLQSGRPLNERLRLLEEVSLLFNFAGGAEAAAMVRMYERLGMIAADEGPSRSLWVGHHGVAHGPNLVRCERAGDFARLHPRHVIAPCLCAGLGIGCARSPTARNSGCSPRIRNKSGGGKRINAPSWSGRPRWPSIAHPSHKRMKANGSAGFPAAGNGSIRWSRKSARKATT